MRIITISERIKQEIAEKVCEQASPGYSSDAQGEWFVVNGTAVMHKQRNAPWAPWPDDADVIAVDNLVNLFGGGSRCDFDPTVCDVQITDADAWEIAVRFALDYVPNSYDAEAYEAQYG